MSLKCGIVIKLMIDRTEGYYYNLTLFKNKLTLIKGETKLSIYFNKYWI